MSSAQAVCIGEALTVLVQAAGGPLENAVAFRRDVGGAELNVAFALAHQGVRTALLTRVGDDGFGRHLIAEAAARGVDVSAVEVDPVRATGMYVKEIGGDSGGPTDLGPGGSRMIYFRRDSAGSDLSPAYLDRHGGLIREAAVVHFTGITPALSEGAREMCVRLAATRPGGVVLSFDVNWRPRLWAGREAEGAAVLLDLARRSDVVLLGRGEARVLLGIEDADQLRRLLPEPRWLIVKNDGEPAVAFDGAERAELAATRITPTETIGAGDAFAAGFLGALLERRALPAALEHAHRMASLVLATTGDSVGASL